MEKINFSPIRGDFKNEEQKCICLPIKLSEGFDVAGINDLADLIEKKYPDLIFTKRWSTYNKDGEEGYMFFYQ